ncbi:sodium-dependent neutral amino acid transporter B(0)AT1 [Patella vulgata]|uniref:sodium-dependent neutral amino acid transporter B(0)AT1 n=1 Tax=Patella vulgata TaxID=6465 RepID=UPI0021801634|nr:sodium-dependent neutral amino acid transporter B(0)AT1 [Patella vulgata]
MCVMLKFKLFLSAFTGFKSTMAYEKCLETQGNVTTGANGTVVCDFKKLIEESASGTGLAFIAFTEAINQFPVAPLWAVLFFLMLFTLGLDSMFGTLEGALTSIYDMMLFPHLRKEIVCGVVCLASCIISLCFATNTGPYVFSLFDSFSANIPLLVIAFMECVSISYVYGLEQLSDDIELMLGGRPSYFFLFAWKYMAPVSMVVILVASLVEMYSTGVSYEIWNADLGMAQTIPWPWWCQVVAVCLILCSLLWIPGVAIAKYFKLVEYKEESPAFFPSEELREERNIMPHKSNAIERALFGFKK